MKNISLALNVVLGLAVVVLYYIHFTGGPSASPATSAMANIPVAFINADTVLKYYDYSKENLSKLEAKGIQLDKDLKARAASLQGEFESYQRNRNSMTIGQAGAVEEDLARKRNNLQMYQESLSQQLMMENEKMNRELYEKVTSYLREYSRQNGIQIILKYNSQSDLLYAGDSLNITTAVVKGLNEAYLIDKQKPVAKDSTAKKQ